MKLLRIVLACGIVAAGCGMLLSLRRQRSFLGEVVVITGGSRGLGLELARQFGRDGALPVLLARDEEELAKAVDELSASGIEARSWRCDLCDSGEINRVIHEIAESCGGIDLLVNNAGQMLVGPLATMTKEDFERGLAIHLWAPLHAARAALPFLRNAKKPGIVNIVSIGGRIAVPHMAPYCVSKFALAGWSAAIQAELALQGISVTTVFPGLMRTGSHVNAKFKGDAQKEFTWFSIAAGFPGISIDPGRAASRIVAAARNGSPELIIGWSAKTATVIDALIPGVTRRMIALANRFLPSGDGDGAARSGWRSCPRWGPDLLTILADRNIDRFNQRPVSEDGPR
jgi:short-subunit dehydrogenase